MNAAFIGLNTICIGLFLLMLSGISLLKDYSASLRLIAGIQCLGGLLLVLSAYMDDFISHYAFVIVGSLLILSSFYIAYELRPAKRKRKAKPKNLT